MVSPGGAADLANFCRPLRGLNDGPDSPGLRPGLLLCRLLRRLVETLNSSCGLFLPSKYNYVSCLISRAVVATLFGCFFFNSLSCSQKKITGVTISTCSRLETIPPSTGVARASLLRRRRSCST